MIRLGLFGLALVATAHAAKAPDWVTSALAQPTASRAAAICYDHEEVVDLLPGNRMHARIRYVMKLMAEQGRNAMNLREPFNSDTGRIVSANAWIVSQNGTRTKAYRRGDFFDVAAYPSPGYWDASRAVVFVASDKVQVGDVVAGEIELEGSGVFELACNFVPPVATLRQDYEVRPPPGVKLAYHVSSDGVPDPIPGSAPGSLRWEEGVRAPRTGARPEAFLVNLDRLAVRLVQPDLPASWPATAAFAYRVTEPRIAVSPEVRAEAAELAKPDLPRWERIRAFTEFVQQRIVYLEQTDDTDTLAGMRPHLPADVLAKRYGDCKDKATLLVALLRAAGEDGRLVLVMNGDPKAVSPDWPTLGFNHAIAAIPATADTPEGWPTVDLPQLGKFVVFDPTDSVVPLGVLPVLDQGGWALLVDRDHGSVIRLPQADGPRHFMRRTLDATLDPAGQVEVALHQIMEGMPAAESFRLRHALRDSQMADFFKTAVRTTTPLATDATYRNTWDPRVPRFTVEAGFRAPHYGRSIGGNLMAVAPMPVPEVGNFPPWKTNAEGVSWLWTGNIHSTVHLKLPVGYAIEELPVNWERHGAIVHCSLSYVSAPGEVTFDSDFQLKPGFYDKDRYEAIRAFVVKFHEAEVRPILLRRTADAHS